MSTKCVSYYRTSSSTNTGEEKDSLKRQKSVVHRYCHNNGFKIESEFYETLRGDGEILSRPKFMEMMEFCDANDVKTIVFENTTRFSRDLICSETGYVYRKVLDSLWFPLSLLSPLLMILPHPFLSVEYCLVWVTLKRTQ